MFMYASAIIGVVKAKHKAVPKQLFASLSQLRHGGLVLFRL